MAAILILGALSDVSKALAHAYAKEGNTIMLAARQVSRLQPLQSDLNIRYQTTVTAHEFDARAFETHDDFYKNLPQVPDLVICVFGYLGDNEKALAHWSEAAAIIESNYTGAVSILNIAATDMMARKKGGIIGIGSVAGDRGRQSNFIYGSAKAGFTAYLSGLRNKLFHAGIHVLTVSPGFIRTAMTEGMPLPAPLTAQPEQIANDIIKAWKRKKNVLYTLWMWRYIMFIIRNIPEGIFKKLSL